MARIAATCGAALLCAALVAADSTDVRTLGPQVGTTAPGFSLPDQNGRLRTLASLMGPKGAILVFFRSADW